MNDILGIISSIHRAFSLFEDIERDNNYDIAISLTNEITKPKPNLLSLMANIDLMYYCLSNNKIESAMIQEKIKYVLSQKEKSNLKDIDDLPVEAFYYASLKLIEIGKKDLIKEVASDALSMIGNLRSIRKEFFESILM